MSMTSILLSIAMGWIHQSLKLGTSIRDRQSHHRSVLRLASQLRDDIHHSEQVALVGREVFLLRVNETTQVTYEVDESVVTRVTVRNQETLNRESYECMPGTVIRWMHDDSLGQAGVTVYRAVGHALKKSTEDSLSTDSEPKEPPEMVVAATLGRWHPGKVGADP